MNTKNLCGNHVIDNLIVVPSGKSAVYCAEHNAAGARDPPRWVHLMNFTQITLERHNKLTNKCLHYHINVAFAYERCVRGI